MAEQRDPEIPDGPEHDLSEEDMTSSLFIGNPVPVTWTKLSKTAEQGSDVITLMQAVSWQPGDDIVIPTTNHRHSMGENEKHTIKAISKDGITLTLTKPLKYTHISMVQNLHGVTLETRGEVGLLTRNIKIQGSVQDEWTETIPKCKFKFDSGQFATQSCFRGRFGEEIGSDEFGAQVMLAAREPDKDLVTGRLEYVEFTHTGQAYRLGHYTLHFHMNGNINGSYVRGCAFHRTFNRATTIHGVHHLLVENNVAYDIMGHAIFTEDGIEENNIIQGNLVVYTHASSSLLNTDITPAAYWLVNPNNIVRNNHAAGGTHFGFWYRTLNHPEGPSATNSYCQKNAELGEFSNNSAHSMGWFGLWIFSMPGYFPMKGPETCRSKIPTTARFNTLTAWRCEKGAEVVHGGNIRFVDFILADNEDAGMVWTELFGPWGQDGPGVDGGAIIGHSAISDNTECTREGLKTVERDRMSVDGMHFINFDRPSCAALSGCCKANKGGFSAQFENIKWSNSQHKARWHYPHEGFHYDLDGSLTGKKGNIMLPTNANLPPGQCTFGGAEYSRGVSGAVCEDPIDFHRLSFNKPSPKSLLYKDVIFTNKYGSSVVPYRKKRLTHMEGWMVTVMDSDRYLMTYRDRPQLTNITYSATYYDFAPNEYVIISHNFTQRPDVFSTQGKVKPSRNSMVTFTDNLNGDIFFNNDTDIMSYLVSGKISSSTFSVDASGNDDDSTPIKHKTNNAVNRQIKPRVIRCFYKDCIPPVPPPPPEQRPDAAVFWSEADSWVGVEEGYGGYLGNGIYQPPENGTDVQILPGLWMVADVQLPWMKKLYIYGTLEIANTQDNILNCSHVLIQGGRLIVGFNETEPFLFNFQLILRGEHATPDMPLPEGPNMGAKALGVFGGLDIHGISRAVYWTQLSQTAQAGAKSIVLVTPVDWLPGDNIVIAPTSYEANEAEVLMIVNISEDGRTVNLNASLTHKHLGVTHTSPGGAATYTMAAEVGVLTRNVKVIGENYPGLFSESFGARVIVGRFKQDGVEYKGFARVTNTEFYHTGQEGWTEPYDPRYSLAFLETGTSSQETPSYVKGCAFHHGFSPALGLYGASGVLVQDNVVHHTVGAGMVIEGDNNRLYRNLVVLSIFPGTYQERFEEENLLWEGGIEVHGANKAVLINNTVAGSERCGFKVKGEPCDITMASQDKWTGNTAHTVLHGVHQFNIGLPKCSKISNFFVYNSYDFGIYHQTSCSMVLSDNILVDNVNGIMPLIYSPPATSHRTSDKVLEVSNTVFIGASPSLECNVPRPNGGRSRPGVRAPRTKSGGHAGFVMSSFESGPVSAPFFPWHKPMSYPTINGHTILKDNTFISYKGRCGKKDDIAIMTNPSSEDAQHPITATGSKFVDVTVDNKLYIHRPSLGLVNPSDCVDMDCDGLKKILIRDETGSIIGDNLPGTIFSQAEFEWDGNPRRGLGDYRIPRMMLTREDGSRIPVSDKAPNKGIIRNSNCKWHNRWQAYSCHNLDHQMMIVESMDPDTETRRVSPLAMLADGYVDLVNGPQDHGWCFGYTCQERISTFNTIVAMQKNYEMYFTGTNPQKLRLHLLNTNSSSAVVVGIWYATPQRLDVYRNNLFIWPTNSKLKDGKFKLIAKDPLKPNNQFVPDLSSQVSGLNWMDSDLQTLYVLVRGPDPIEIRTMPVVVFSVDVPPVPLNKFYEKNTIRNIALLLKIPEDRIRFVNVVRETRFKRSGTLNAMTIKLEIGDPPSPTINTPPEDNNYSTEGSYNEYAGIGNQVAMTYDQLKDIAATLTESAQTGKLAENLGQTVYAVTITDPLPPAVDPTGGVRATNGTGGSPFPQPGEPLYYEKVMAKQISEMSNLDIGTVYQVPVQFVLQNQPLGSVEMQPFSTQPAIQALDRFGQPVLKLGQSTSRWNVTAKLVVESGLPGTELQGNTTVEFLDSWANFSNLAINLYGTNQSLQFLIQQVSLTLNSEEFTTMPRQLKLVDSAARGRTSSPGLPLVPQPIVQIYDDNDLLNREEINVKGPWTCEARLHQPDNYYGDLQGDKKVQYDPTTQQCMFKDLGFSHPGYGYIIHIVVKSLDGVYELSTELDGIDVLAITSTPVDATTSDVELIFDVDYDRVIQGQEKYFSLHALNHLGYMYPNISITDVSFERDGSSAMKVSFYTTGAPDTLSFTHRTMYEDIKRGLRFTFNGRTFSAFLNMKVNGEQFYGKDGPPSKGAPLGVIIGVPIAVVLILIILGVLLLVKSKHTKKNQVSDSNSHIPPDIPLEQMTPVEETTTPQIRAHELKPPVRVEIVEAMGPSASAAADVDLLPAIQTVRPKTAMVNRTLPNEVMMTPTPPKVSDAKIRKPIYRMNTERSFTPVTNIKVGPYTTLDNLRRQIRPQMEKNFGKMSAYVFLNTKLTPVTPHEEKEDTVLDTYGREAVLLRTLKDTDVGMFYCICGSVASLPCVLCNSVKYCSPACQSIDYTSHQTQCKSIQDDTSSNEHIC
ncbi:unnamed protein product [Owenia fusiformis]|uniref:G8 domain-containing protein n=1 Tax=Owenia fusiformis TaxID=6347 RepID=A0A8S4N4D2_OWEFU|nr:unnamed protein product [Owenia fusiformis]